MARKGEWDHTSYAANESAKRSAGYTTGMKHTEDIKSRRVTASVHSLVDAKHVAGPASPNAGKIIRESFDSDEYPNSKPVFIAFDITASMRKTPYTFQQKLGQLHGLVQRKGYIEDPHFGFGAIGDARNREVAPLQVGQFEADNRGDAALENIYIEENGGGGNHESYELMAYYLAYHTDIDSWNKRQQKGLLFLLGDERIYATVREVDVRRYIGDAAADEFKARFESNEVSTKVVFEELQKRWDVYFLFVQQGSYNYATAVDEKAGVNGGTSGDAALGWEAVLPKDRIVTLEEAEAVTETIGLLIGVHEGTIDLDEGLDDLKDLGADDVSVAAAGKALATVGGGGGGGGAIAKTQGGPNLGGSGAERL